MRRRSARRVLRLFLGIVLVYAAFNGFVADRIYQYASVRDDIKADAAIVLGASAWGDLPSPVFAARIDHAVSLYADGMVRTLILTGGARDPASPPESVVARNYAIDHGVPASATVVDTISRTTYENLVEARKLACSIGARTLLIVSDPLHERRAMTIASDLHLLAHPSPTPTNRYRSWTSRLVFLARETVLLSFYLIARTLTFW